MPVCRIFNEDGEEIKRFSTDDFVSMETMSVGRSSSSEVSLKNLPGVTSTVGRTHFFLVRKGKQWGILHAGSNGIYKDGRQVGETALVPGDMIKFGSCFLLVGDRGGPSDFSLSFEEELGKFRSLRLWQGRNYVGTGAGSTIKLSDPSCSKNHAVITVDGTSITVEDMQSTNGTHVAGARITTPIKLSTGQELKLGHLRCQILAVDVKTAKPVTPEQEARREQRALLLCFLLALGIIAFGLLLKLLRQ